MQNFFAQHEQIVVRSGGPLVASNFHFFCKERAATQTCGHVSISRAANVVFELFVFIAVLGTIERAESNWQFCF